MKKSITVLFLFVFLAIITACNRQDIIKKEDLKFDFSVYDLLPQTIVNNENKKILNLNIDTNPKYQSLTYYRLLKSYQYINELFEVYNSILEISINEDTLKMGETYQFMDYTYFVTKRNNTLIVRVEDEGIERNLTLYIKTLDNGSKEYSGTHQLNQTTFKFKLINDKYMTTQLIKERENVTAYATISKEENYVKTTISYDNSVYHYDLVSLATDELSSVYYDYKQEDYLKNNSFEVYNKNNELIYTAYLLNNGKITASGWVVDQLTNYKTIEKINDNVYLVDKEPFMFLEGKSNILEIDLVSIDDSLQNKKVKTRILGTLEYNDDIENIIHIREPFKSNYYEQVDQIARDIRDEYLKVKTE